MSKQEFRHALPLLGMEIDIATSDTFFATLDEDGGGYIQYSELKRMLRRRLADQAGDATHVRLNPRLSRAEPSPPPYASPGSTPT